MSLATSGKPKPDEARRHLHDMWRRVAGAWETHAAYADERGADVTRQMLDAVSPQPGERVLELACGPASVGLSASERVGPAGHVVLSDVVAEMTSVAAARADALGLTNVSTSVLDFEQIDEPDGSYDVVLCREGLMFAADPAAAVREMARVLRPGGRTAVAVWGPRERNPWLGLVFDAVSAQLGRPIPPPGVPGPFSLDDADRLASLLSAAGLADVAVREVPVPLQAAGFDEWWERTRSLAGPLTNILAALPAETDRALRDRLSGAVAPYEGPDGLTIPGVTLLAVARRP